MTPQSTDVLVAKRQFTIKVPLKTKHPDSDFKVSSKVLKVHLEKMIYFELYRDVFLVLCCFSQQQSWVTVKQWFFYK